jgi:hypothetical protein
MEPLSDCAPFQIELDLIKEEEGSGTYGTLNDAASTSIV